eukprot:SAG11_NODE_4764_length_1776_cov_1.983900_3_plen_111_part_00
MIISMMIIIRRDFNDHPYLVITLVPGYHGHGRSKVQRIIPDLNLVSITCIIGIVSPDNDHTDNHTSTVLVLPSFPGTFLFFFPRGCKVDLQYVSICGPSIPGYRYFNNNN